VKPNLTQNQLKTRILRENQKEKSKKKEKKRKVKENLTVDGLVGGGGSIGPARGGMVVG
jgi:hypothetical protein